MILAIVSALVLLVGCALILFNLLVVCFYCLGLFWLYIAYCSIVLALFACLLVVW